jgi:hypothetical protein
VSSRTTTNKQRVTTLVRPDKGKALMRLPSRGLQELWFVTLKKPWRTLALVPAQSGLSIRPLAEALSTIGQLHRGTPLQIISAEGMSPEQLAELTVSTQDAPEGEPGRLIVLEPITVNPLGTAVAMAADSSLLCVEYGTADLGDAKRTLDQIGRERFIGCVALSRE